MTPTTPNRPLTRPCVLFVDDEPNVLDALRRDFHFRAKEWSMRFAHNGRQALAVMDEQKADVVVTDIAMPLMDGEGLIEALRDIHPDTSIIVLSGHWTQSTSFHQVGPTVTFLAKPVSRELLDWTIRKTLHDRRPLPTPPAEPAAPLRPRPVEFVSIDEAGVESMGWTRMLDDDTSR